jgi:hypothetical protein
MVSHNSGPSMTVLSVRRLGTNATLVPEPAGIARKSIEFRAACQPSASRRIPPNHEKNGGPSLVGALVRQAGGRWFEPSTAHLGTRRKWRVSLCGVICSASRSHNRGHRMVTLAPGDGLTRSRAYVKA